MLFTQAAKLEPQFCSGDYRRAFLATPKLIFPCSFVFSNCQPSQAQVLPSSAKIQVRIRNPTGLQARRGAG
jgi:hypothetical protein